MSAELSHFDILLIDDDLQERFVLERILAVISDVPVRVDHAVKCSEGVGLLNRNAYDLVLLDDRLSDTVSATFSVPFIRSSFSRAPVAIISTDVSPLHLQDAAALGVEHIVDKADLIGFLHERMQPKIGAALRPLGSLGERPHA